MSDMLVAIFLSGIVLEFILTLIWLPWYFRVGIPIFHMRIKVDDSFDFARELSSANQTKELMDSCGFSVKQISMNEMAIREKLFIISRSATLHGLIRYSPDEREIIAWGFINWSLLLFIGLFFSIASHVPGFVWPIALLIILATVTGKIKNLKRFIDTTTGIGHRPVG